MCCVTSPRVAPACGGLTLGYFLEPLPGYAVHPINDIFGQQHAKDIA